MCKTPLPIFSSTRPQPPTHTFAVLDFIITVSADYRNILLFKHPTLYNQRGAQYKNYKPHNTTNNDKQDRGWNKLVLQKQETQEKSEKDFEKSTQRK